MIIVTGAAGFIGSVLLGSLHAKGYADLVAVDEFETPAKAANLAGLPPCVRIHRDELLPWLEANAPQVQAILHMGARTDTTSLDLEAFNRLNLDYSKRLWHIASRWAIPLIYASSAATYGAGENGFSDEPANLARLKPLNPYAQSKHDFDVWAAAEAADGRCPLFWAGFKFFNVFGPNEGHKGRMASVVWHGYQQILATGELILFESHKPGIAHGAQARDFIYVKDLVAVLIHAMEMRSVSGIYNLGTGMAHTFEQLGLGLFKALGQAPRISYRPMPPDLREHYQYYTQAQTDRLVQARFAENFTRFDEAIRDYVRGHLMQTP